MGGHFGKQAAVGNPVNRIGAKEGLAGTACHMGDDLRVGTGRKRRPPVAQIKGIAAGEQLPVARARRLPYPLVVVPL